jgi:hypothetical protein
MNRQQLLQKLARAWTEFKESYAGLSDAQLAEPGIMGDWSVKDMLAHVTWWEEEALTHLPLIIKEGRPPRYATRYGGIDAFNALMTERKRDLSFADILQQQEAIHRQLIDYLQCSYTCIKLVLMVGVAWRGLSSLQSTPPFLCEHATW